MDFTTHNSALTKILPSIEAYQDSYIKSKPKFFQGLPTDSSVPAQATTPDNTSQKPTGQAESWDDTGIITEQLPFSMEIHEYIHPQGRGWHLSLYTKDDKGNVFVKRLGYGPEAKTRTFDWTLMSPK